MKPLLTGTRILDLTTVVLGPYATQLLADLGAEVIKIEPPEGEICRHVGHAKHPDMAPLYLNLNRNKKSVVLNLKQAQDRATLLELAERADVFVHNMRPSAVKRLGVGYDALASRNERLIYCAAWGFGADGPYGDLPAYDDVVQAASGLAALNQVDGVPRYMPTILADKVTGMFVANSILAALMHRERSGRGQFIEVPMLECLVSFIMAEHLAGATYEPPLTKPGYERILGTGRRLYKTKDGYIAILPYMTDHWVRFLTHIGRHDLAESPTVLDPQKRSHAIEMLYGAIAAATPAKTRAQWFAELKALEIPCMPVNGIDELFDNEHLRAVGTFKTMDHPTEGRLRSVEFPARFSGVAEAPDRPAPGLGQDTDDVLGRRR
jgi:crotonobetainyl-CoA:carnitine CoA-transferase CaiB-like acyl-CoA transferase